MFFFITRFATKKCTINGVWKKEDVEKWDFPDLKIVMKGRGGDRHQRHSRLLKVRCQPSYQVGKNEAPVLNGKPPCCRGFDKRCSIVIIAIAPLEIVGLISGRALIPTRIRDADSCSAGRPRPMSRARPRRRLKRARSAMLFVATSVCLRDHNYATWAHNFQWSNGLLLRCTRRRCLIAFAVAEKVSSPLSDRSRCSRNGITNNSARIIFHSQFPQCLPPCEFSTFCPSSHNRRPVTERRSRLFFFHFIFQFKFILICFINLFWCQFLFIRVQREAKKKKVGPENWFHCRTSILNNLKSIKTLIVIN